MATAIRPVWRTALLAVALALPLPCLAEEATDDVLMRAIRDELKRATEQLRTEHEDPPYFVAYRIDEIESAIVAASFGALLSRSTDKSRTLAIEIRVGDAELDNTNFLPRSWRPRSNTQTTPLPLDADYNELRRHIWLTTDAAYKHTLEMLAKKRAALRSRSREAVPDFSTEERHTWRAPQTATAANIDIEPLATTARSLSGLFRERPEINESFVSAFSFRRRTHYVNSEGTSFVRNQTLAMVNAVAGTQASDGTVLQDFEVFSARTWQQIPKQATMAETVRTMAAALTARRHAAVLERYSGPVLIQGQAAAELLAQALAPRLLVTRVPVMEDERSASYAASLRNPFEDKVGARVLPRWLSVRDDPTLQRNDGGELLGGYAVDAEGVPATATVLVEKGVLKTLLSSRNPTADSLQSSGNQRGEYLLPSNLVVSASEGLDDAALTARFAELVAERGNEYGVAVRHIGNARLKVDFGDAATRSQGGLRLERPTRAYKVYPDGREEPIRKLEFSGFAESNFRDIVAASRSNTNYSLRPAPAGSNVALRAASALYGSTPRDLVVSLSVPDLLFEELTLRKPTGNVPRPPILTHPFFPAAAQ